MKRVCNDSKLKPEKVNNRTAENYSNRRGMLKNYEF